MDGSVSGRGEFTGYGSKYHMTSSNLVLIPHLEPAVHLTGPVWGIAALAKRGAALTAAVRDSDRDSGSFSCVSNHSADCVISLEGTWHLRSVKVGLDRVPETRTINTLRSCSRISCFTSTFLLRVAAGRSGFCWKLLLLCSPGWSDGGRGP